VVHVYKNANQQEHFHIDRTVSGNLLVIKVSYKSNRFKYFYSAKALWKGINIAKKEKGAIDRLFLNVFYPLGAHLWWLKTMLSAPIYAIEHWTGFHVNTPIYDDQHRHLKIARWASRYCTKVIGVSKNLGAAMINQGIKNVDGVVYNTVNEEIFKYTGNLEKKVFTFLHISSLKDNHKNFSLLLKAFAVVSQGKHAKLMVINSGDEKPYLPVIDDLKIQSKIEFTGIKTIEEVAEIMQQCHAFVLSSNYENMPCVIEEALCCGLPVISTQVGGIAEIINEKNGYLVPKQNAIQLSKAMDVLMEDYDSFDRGNIAKEAIAKFSKPAVLAQMEKELSL
jgi:glycosyltransferase involved in cell wall biosynthesis